LNGWLTQARPGQLLYHPYISEAGERGPFIDVSARASLIGLNSGHRFPDIVRSVVEGLGLSARHCYSAMGEIPREIVVTGGAARADELRRILGACLGADLRRATREEAGATGAAMIAAVGVGLAPDMRTIIKDWVSPTLSSPEGPDAGLVQKYNQIFPSYTASVAALAPIWKQL
ncbi:MAG: FGGY-family carbohydrate kinase, partial [Brucella pseudogrignonensis]